MHYPHTITIQAKATGSRDTSGNWIAGADAEPAQYKCRYEVDGVKTITGPDGKRIEVAAIVYMDRTGAIIPEGAKVEVLWGGGLVTGTVKKFSPGLMNSRLWL